jgi:membrane protease YdiL (CAAX protease family)
MTKRSALLALLLLVPAPSIGVLVGMIIAPNLFGRVVFFTSKIWILSLPLFWHLFIDRQKLSLSISSSGGFVAAPLAGVIVGTIILSIYFIAGRYLIEPQIIKDMAGRIGIDKPHIYIGAAIYWILINSALEEYVWRWFVVQKCKLLLPTNAAILVSALCFTIHHIIAMQIYFNGVVVLIASAGIFIAGTGWSWCYNRYHSIWPGYLNHAIIDIVVFVIGYTLIFQ